MLPSNGALSLGHVTSRDVGIAFYTLNTV